MKKIIYFVLFIALASTEARQFFQREKSFLRTPQDLQHSYLDRLGCKVAISRQTYFTLNNVCEQCYDLYLDLSAYHLCRSVFCYKWGRHLFVLKSALYICHLKSDYNFTVFSAILLVFTAVLKTHKYMLNIF